MSEAETDQTATAAPAPAPVVVKKYANRRLYNTESSSYITLDSLATMIRVGRDFVVYDAKSGEDITRGVLTQIIVEEESKGRAMLPTAFLRQIIGFYGDSLQQFVPGYLESAMSNFALQQEQMRTAMEQTMGNFFPPGMQEVGRQNIAMMERAMSLFAPFYRHQPQGQTPGKPAAADANGLEGGEAATPAASPANGEVQALRNEVDLLRAQLAAARASAVVQLKESAPAKTAAKEPGTGSQ
jgi:polyhydroxyalkanoate synthesis repressor PhaR